MFNCASESLESLEVGVITWMLHHASRPTEFRSVGATSAPPAFFVVTRSPRLNAPWFNYHMENLLNICWKNKLYLL